VVLRAKHFEVTLCTGFREARLLRSRPCSFRRKIKIKYVSNLSEIISLSSVQSLIFLPSLVSQRKFDVSLSQYADDKQLYVVLSKKAVNDAVTNLQNCLFDVHTWFSQNGLVINPEKSEAVLLVNYTAC